MSKTPLWLLANQTTFYLQSQPGLGLQFKQELFSRKPAAVTCQRTITADHPMTGCEYRYGICAVGIGNRTDSFGHTDTQGHFSIRDRLSERYFQQFVPHSLLKVRTNEKEAADRTLYAFRQKTRRVALLLSQLLPMCQPRIRHTASVSTAGLHDRDVFPPASHISRVYHQTNRATAGRKAIRNVVP